MTERPEPPTVRMSVLLDAEPSPIGSDPDPGHSRRSVLDPAVPAPTVALPAPAPPRRFAWLPPQIDARPVLIVPIVLLVVAVAVGIVLTRSGDGSDLDASGDGQQVVAGPGSTSIAPLTAATIGGSGPDPLAIVPGDALVPTAPDAEGADPADPADEGDPAAPSTTDGVSTSSSSSTTDPNDPTSSSTADPTGQGTGATDPTERTTTTRSSSSTSGSSTTSMTTGRPGTASTARPATTTSTTRSTSTTAGQTTTTRQTTTTTRATTTTTRATTTSTTVGGNPSGTIIWQDDFNRLDTSTWRLEHSTYGDGNNELQCYVPGNVSVSGGRLVLQARTETVTCPNGSTRQVSSGMVRSRGVTFSPGQAIEFRVKLTPADPNDQSGLWPAVWASGWGGGGWPTGGELDWLEVMTAEDPTRAMFSMHYAGPDGRHRLQNQGVRGGANFSDAWHTVRFDYGRDGRLRWYLDGALAFAVDAADTLQGYPAPFDQTIGEIKINLALGGRPGPLSPGAVGSTGATFEVDYIRIIQL